MIGNFFVIFWEIDLIYIKPIPEILDAIFDILIPKVKILGCNDFLQVLCSYYENDQVVVFIVINTYNVCGSGQKSVVKGNIAGSVKAFQSGSNQSFTLSLGYM